MKTERSISLDQIREFVGSSTEIEFEAHNKKEKYEWIRTTLVEHSYHRQGKADKGLVRKYIAKMTGSSIAQVTRLIKQYLETGKIEQRQTRRRTFPRRYTVEDIELLAKVDEAHETLSGPATKTILYRGLYEYKDPTYKRLANISVAHIYNLRATAAYRRRRVVFQKTKPTSVSIGERRKPETKGRPGFIRVDTVHQGDRDGNKGVYHITAVDEETQWTVLGSVERISEAHMIPVLEQMLEEFPFTILGFHSDNGSEYINQGVMVLLKKLMAEQTKSRPRHTNDNGLVESKNAALVRKHMGYGYIAARHAPAINKFYRDYFNPYVNFHRPCAVPEKTTNKKGKEKVTYNWYATPWEILRQLSDVARRLKPGVTLESLTRLAKSMSDTAAAQLMQLEKQRLFQTIS